DEMRLKTALSDPLFPGYLTRALATQLISSVGVLDSVSKAILAPHTPAISKYPLLRLINHAVILFKPTYPVSTEQISVLWNVKDVLYRLIQHNEQEQNPTVDPVYVEALNAWNILMSSKTLRPLFREEKEKNSGKSFFGV